MTKKTKIMLLLFLTIIMKNSSNTFGDDWYLKKKDFITIYKENSKDMLFQASWEISEGDRYHSEDNKLYVITKVVNNHVAHAKYVRDVEMPNISNFIQIDNEAFVQVTKQERKVGIYFTHSSESYIPTSGTHSEWASGGIIEVGEEFKRNLENNGIKVIIDKASHDPHDAGSYRRSRRTLVELLREEPDMVFDLHRDAVPKEQYSSEINNTPISKIRIVLGRRNQNININEDLAIKIKAVSDEMYPGLVKDIFYGRGSYNQDLAPTGLLLELGTHTLSQQVAENSTKYMANVIKTIIYGGTLGGKEIEPLEENYDGRQNRVVLLITIGLVLGIGLILLKWRLR